MFFNNIHACKLCYRIKSCIYVISFFAKSSATVPTPYNVTIENVCLCHGKQTVIRQPMFVHTTILDILNLRAMQQS